MKASHISPTTTEKILREIIERAQKTDSDGCWPVVDLAELQAAGAMRWALPRSHGGDELSALDLHLNYEMLAASSVATALILSQRDAAVGLVEAAVDSLCRDRLLHQLASNEIWATVGIAQLTTSRQGGPAAVSATRVPGGYLVDGIIPWCTGAQFANVIVAGAALNDGRQILIALQQGQAGVGIEAAMKLVALSSTLTAAIHLRQVKIEEAWVLRGPTTNVLAGRRNSLTLGQTFIANGLTRSALNLIGEHDSDRARSAAKKFELRLDELRREIIELCEPGRESDAASANARLRGACNDLALRVTHAAVALYKGNALLNDHPAQRLAREALFLLVWSCPNPVIDCTLELLTEN